MNEIKTKWNNLSPDYKKYIKIGTVIITSLLIFGSIYASAMRSDGSNENTNANYGSSDTESANFVISTDPMSANQEEVGGTRTNNKIGEEMNIKLGDPSSSEYRKQIGSLYCMTLSGSSIIPHNDCKLIPNLEHKVEMKKVSDFLNVLLVKQCLPENLLVIDGAFKLSDLDEILGESNAEKIDTNSHFVLSIQSETVMKALKSYPNQELIIDKGTVCLN